MPKAITDIKFGKDNGDVVEIAAGEDVTGLPQDVMDSLFESGSIAEETPDEAQNRERVEELESEILRLRSELGIRAPSPGEAAQEVQGQVNEDSDLDDTSDPAYDPDANPQA